MYRVSFDNPFWDNLLPELDVFWKCLIVPEMQTGKILETPQKMLQLDNVYPNVSLDNAHIEPQSSQAGPL